MGYSKERGLSASGLVFQLILEFVTYMVRCVCVYVDKFNCVINIYCQQIQTFANVQMPPLLAWNRWHGL